MNPTVCLSRREWLALAGSAAAGAWPAQAAAQAGTLVLAVNEGVTYRTLSDEVRGRYAALAADFAKLLGQPVQVEPVQEYALLRQGLANKAFDLALVHPAHVSLQAIKHSGWHLLAVAKGWQDYSARFLVRADSPLKTMAELKGQRIGAPDEDSITAWMVRATLREAIGSAAQAQLTYTRYQDAVPFFVENHLAAAGATASVAVVKDWQAKGGRVLGQSKVVPIKHLIAGPRIGAEAQQRLREYLLVLDESDEGRRKLAPTRLAGFARQDEAALRALGSWLGV